MKLTIKSTTKIVQLVTEDGGHVNARVWEGTTESNIPVHVMITRVAVKNDQDCTQFEKELAEQRAPSFEVQSIPLRFIL